MVQALGGCAVKDDLFVVSTNQQYIDQVRSQGFDLDDVKGTFDKIFKTLPEEVFVYPTENYYYFKFFTAGREIWGNIRLDSLDRQEGLLSFAYFEVHGQTDPYFFFSRSWYKQLSKQDGVEVRQISPLAYSVSSGSKTVKFQLNDLKQEVPANLHLRSSEAFISRNCDESGFQFILVFDRERKAFRYLLDESVPLPDILHPFGKDIYVGMRSGFAFYQEPDLSRKLLFAVSASNSEVNNYYDGPFDQLGDNFVNPQEFERYLVEAYPFYSGKVKGRGDFVDEKGARTGTRVLISAYFTYNHMRELWSRVSECLNRHQGAEDRSACIAQDEKDPAYRNRRKYGKMRRR